MNAPFTYNIYDLTLKTGAVLTVSACDLEAARSCAKRDWRRDMGGRMPAIVTAELVNTRAVLIGDPTPQLISYKEPTCTP